jgi:hypothetical protein
MQGAGQTLQPQKPSFSAACEKSTVARLLQRGKLSLTGTGTRGTERKVKKSLESSDASRCCVRRLRRCAVGAGRRVRRRRQGALQAVALTSASARCWSTRGLRHSWQAALCTDGTPSTLLCGIEPHSRRCVLACLWPRPAGPPDHLKGNTGSWGYQIRNI